MTQTSLRRHVLASVFAVKTDEFSIEDHRKNFLHHTSGILRASIFSFFVVCMKRVWAEAITRWRKDCNRKNTWRHCLVREKSRNSTRRTGGCAWRNGPPCLLRALASNLFGKADTHSWRGSQLLIRSIRIIHRGQSNKYWSTQHCRVSSEVQVSPPETVSAITLPSTPSPLADISSC